MSKGWGFFFVIGVDGGVAGLGVASEAVADIGDEGVVVEEFGESFGAVAAVVEVGGAGESGEEWHGLSTVLFEFFLGVVFHGWLSASRLLMICLRLLMQRDLAT